MSDNSNGSTVQIGPGWLGLLTILLIGLKLTDHIGLSWLWVFAPLWIPLAVALVIFIVGAVLVTAKHLTGRE